MLTRSCLFSSSRLVYCTTTTTTRTTTTSLRTLSTSSSRLAYPDRQANTNSGSKPTSTLFKKHPAHNRTTSDRGKRLNKSSSEQPLPTPYSRDRRFKETSQHQKLFPQSRVPTSKNWSRSPPQDEGQGSGAGFKFTHDAGSDPGSSHSSGSNRFPQAGGRADASLSRIRDRDASTARASTNVDDRFQTPDKAADDAVVAEDATGGDSVTVASHPSSTSGARGEYQEKSDRHYAAKQKKKEGRGSLLSPSLQDGSDPQPSRISKSSADKDSMEEGTAGSKPKRPYVPKIKKFNRNLFVPSMITLIQLATKMGFKLFYLQKKMEEHGYTDVRPDLILKFEDVELLAAELNYKAIKDEDASFDLYPRPPLSPKEKKKHPLRSPVVTIMGHVDHGKTTMLDQLRKTMTHKGEPGGITQHIGAFEVPILTRRQDKGKQKGHKGIQTITFIDTPGHAAFTNMRSRGGAVTDIIVLVVAADDGVMPQTIEVIDLWKKLNAETAPGDDKLQLLVAINKIDKAEADPDKVKRQLLANGVELEEMGGEVPCVHVSGKTGLGLDQLEETLAVMAELADLRAEREGLVEGHIIESKVDKGRGIVATVLMKRGVLVKNAPIVAGGAWCKTRQIIHTMGRPLSQAVPGQPVLVTGWRSFPTAGDLMLGGPDQLSCKKAALNRQRALEEIKLSEDVDVINEQRRLKAEEDDLEARKEYEDRQKRRAARLAADEGKDFLTVLKSLEDDNLILRDTSGESKGTEEANKGTETQKKYLNVIIKADFSGTMEAVKGAISPIGNREAGVKIVSASVGEVSEGDIAKASALDATIIGFNVNPSKSVIQLASRAQPKPVPVIVSDVIYRLMESVSSSVAELLPAKFEIRVQGEATVSQVFEINVKGKTFKKIAGCRITNGLINKSNAVKILRGPERKEVWKGRLDEFKHLKKDVTEMRKGTECGLSFQGFQDIKEGDLIQSYTEVEVPRTL